MLPVTQRLRRANLGRWVKYSARSWLAGHFAWLYRLNQRRKLNEEKERQGGG